MTHYAAILFASTDFSRSQGQRQTWAKFSQHVNKPESYHTLSFALRSVVPSVRFSPVSVCSFLSCVGVWHGRTAPHWR